jgi:hypothetical protein
MGRRVWDHFTMINAVKHTITKAPTIFQVSPS